MSSLYLHIPFCKQACHYCDFHFSTNLSRKADMVQALCREIALQKDYLDSNNLDTVYFGGGTPSLLSEQNLEDIFRVINKFFFINKDAEITLEANPDDISKAKLRVLKNLGFNRLSIGLQSFDDSHLTYLNRVHSARESEDALKLAQNAGFDNLSIDLIYAIPSSSHRVWQQDLEKALSLNITHISAYCLTIEENTVFGNWLKNRKIPAIDEDFAYEQFSILVEILLGNDFEHYETSSFAKQKRYSRHNSNYWKKNAYLGIGPSAHSYDGSSRQYNVAHNIKYLKAIESGETPFEKEILTPQQQLNEYLMTGLRTQWGCSLEKIKKDYKVDLLAHYKAYLAKLQAQCLVIIEHGCLKITPEGRFLADKIASDLFFE